jgi:hypothetical protein
MDRPVRFREAVPAGSEGDVLPREMGHESRSRAGDTTGRGNAALSTLIISCI